jgi:hypothetical protein
LFRLKIIITKQFSNRSNDEWNIYRLVQLVWTKENSEEFPANQKIFGDINLPQGGKVISLENIQGFQEYWNNNNRGGLSGFQNHVREFLNIDTGWVWSSTLA